MPESKPNNRVPRPSVQPFGTLPTDVVRITSESPRCPVCDGSMTDFVYPGNGMGYRNPHGWFCPRCNPGGKPKA